MHSKKSKLFITIFTALFILPASCIIFPGCSRSGNQDVVERVLIRVGGSTVTVREFHEAFESGITSPSVLYSDTEALQKERFRTLNRLTEELVILERARELSIQVSDEELAKAVNDFKQDFPDDTFEQTLIENGVSYLVWEKGLKRRLLLEKVIRQEVSEKSFQVPLPPNDTGATAMDANFEAQMPVDEPMYGEDAPKDNKNDTRGALSENTSESESKAADETTDGSEPESEVETDFSRMIPESESENQYEAWITRLKEQYTIEIDWKLWEEIEQEDLGDV